MDESASSAPSCCHGASACVFTKALRAAGAPDAAAGKVKVMFAENELQAEDLLSQVREAGPSGDD